MSFSHFTNYLTYELPYFISSRIINCWLSCFKWLDFNNCFGMICYMRKYLLKYLSNLITYLPILLSLLTFPDFFLIKKIKMQSSSSWSKWSSNYGGFFFFTQLHYTISWELASFYVFTGFMVEVGNLREMSFVHQMPK